VSLEQTQRAIDRYFGIMGRGGDFADCYTTDVTWITSDTGERIHGPKSVRDYIVALHANMVDMQTRRFRVGTVASIWKAIVRIRSPERATASATASHMT